MLNKIAIFLSFLISTVSAQGCIKSYDALQKLEVRRARNNSINVPATYVICPNTVFALSKRVTWELNGNTDYLCGADGSSTNNCIVDGGDFQLGISYFPFNETDKENIVLSGFTFKDAKISSAAIAHPGNFVIRDCIFKDNINHGGVLSLVLYIPPTPSDRTRMLRSSSNNEPIEFDYKTDLISFMSDPELRQQRMDERHDRSLLIGGGSEPRLTLLLDRVQFLNNALASQLEIPSLAGNGPLNINTAFADVTVSQCLFKDNNFPYSQDLYTGGFGIRVEPSSTLNISNTCFVNDFYEGQSPVWIRADSGLVSSHNNFVSEVDEVESRCEYMFMEEAYKCVAPETNTCDILGCAASYKIYNARTSKFKGDIVNGGTIQSPPCALNIEVVLPCGSTRKTVQIELLLQNGTVATARNETAPLFLFGNSKDDIFAGKLASGTYTIQAISSGTVLPSPRTFTLSGNCVY